MENSSVKNMWNNYANQHLKGTLEKTPRAMHFCDTEKDANHCVELIKSGLKKATTSSLIGIQNRNEKLPKIGDFTVVTNWGGKAQCIVETTKVTLKPFFSVDEAYARLDSEKDNSLMHWKKVHMEYYTKEFEAFNRKPNESMIVVCQEFKVVFNP